MDRSLSFCGMLAAKPQRPQRKANSHCEVLRDLRSFAVRIYPIETEHPMRLRKIKGLLFTLTLGMCLLVSIHTARAIELWSSIGGDRYYSLDAALKWTSLLSHAPEDTALYPERWSAATLWRMRLSFGAQPTSWLNAEIAYEQRARTVSEHSGEGGGSGVLLSGGRAPYRIWQLDEPLVEIGSTFSYRHELDRAFAAMVIGRTEITVGRQAVGWGRGVLFGAVDIFAPFSPLESDRDWRRGIDAVRANVPLTDTISLDAVAAVGESLDASSFVGRVRGYVGNVDGELIFGKRYKDVLYAATASSPVYDAELHGEIAFFNTPEACLDGGTLGKDDLIAKAVIGGSYSLDMAGELLVLAEYHFSGFGVREIEEAETCLDDEAFQERYLRGDSQILGRHACAVQASYGIAGVTPLNISWIFSPLDGSGVLTSSVSWIFSDNVTLVANAYFPYGAEPEDGQIKSEYGGTPVSGLVQIRFYY